MPFIVDSVTMELGRQGYGIDLVIHPVVRVRRDDDGRLIDVVEPGADATARSRSRSSTPRSCASATRPSSSGCTRTSSACSARCASAVEDWQAMRAQDRGAVSRSSSASRRPSTPPRCSEVKEFLKWVSAHHFTFLGYREYDLVDEGEEAGLQAVPDSGLGILRNAPRRRSSACGPRRSSSRARRTCSC